MKRIKEMMKKIRLYALIDFLFFNLAFFLILFAWVRFLTKEIFAAVVISLFILVVMNFVRNVIKKEKSGKKTSVSNKEKEIESTTLSLLACSSQENSDFFLKVFKSFKEAEKKDDFIVFDDKVVCLDFGQKIIGLDCALKKIRLAERLRRKRLLFLCYAFDEKDKLFVENLKNIEVKVMEKAEIYNNLFLKTGIFPEKTFEVKATSKLRFKQLVNMSFRRDKAKKYFLSGLLVFFCSLIVTRSIFYVLMSSLMFFFALLSLSKKEKTKEFFD